MSKYLHVVTVFILLSSAALLWAYPPAVGITSKSKNCLACHLNNGPWNDEENTLIDILILEKKTTRPSGQSGGVFWAPSIGWTSLKQPDGTFLISAHRGETKELITVIGRKADDKQEKPYRNGWIFVDPTRIATSSLNKFAPGWSIDLPASCRLVGDSDDLGHPKFLGAHLTALPFKLRPEDGAKDAELSWQIMITKGEPVKGNAKQGMLGNYYEKKVILKVVD
jgi:hypothetical protein